MTCVVSLPTRLIEFDSLDGLDRRDMATSPTNPKQAPKGRSYLADLNRVGLIVQSSLTNDS